MEGDTEAIEARLGTCQRDMQTWSGIIQGDESSKAGERPVVDDGDLVVVQPSVKTRYERAW